MCRKSPISGTQVLFVNSQARAATVKKMTAKGLELEYVPGARPLEEEVTVNIFQWGDCPVAIPEVSCKRVADNPVLAADRSYSGETIRRCSLEYAELSSEQRKKVEIVVNRFEKR